MLKQKNELSRTLNAWREIFNALVNKKNDCHDELRGTMLTNFRWIDWWSALQLPIFPNVMRNKNHTYGVHNLYERTTHTHSLTSLIDVSGITNCEILHKWIDMTREKKNMYLHVFVIEPDNGSSSNTCVSCKYQRELFFLSGGLREKKIPLVT